VWLFFESVECHHAIQTPVPKLKSNNTAATALVGIGNVSLTAFIIATLYFARDILIPLALAALLTFLLTPPVTRLAMAGTHRRGAARGNADSRCHCLTANSLTALYDYVLIPVITAVEIDHRLELLEDSQRTLVHQQSLRNIVEDLGARPPVLPNINADKGVAAHTCRVY